MCHLVLNAQSALNDDICTCQFCTYTTAGLCQKGDMIFIEVSPLSLESSQGRHCTIRE